MNGIELKNFAQLRGAARLFNISLGTVQNAINRGQLKKYYLGGGTIVVSLIECKKLWENGAKVGRPRKRDKNERYRP